MSEEIRIDGTRDVRVTIDSPDADRAVVACPPHPQMGGSRTDQRLRAVGDALASRDIACLRFDYGPWDEGTGERTDARNALAYARDNYSPVGLFGYSFGAAIALCVAAEADPQPVALSVLAPPSTVGEGLDTVGALAGIDCPVQVCYGERDDTVEWEPVVERARGLGYAVEPFPADHFFVGQAEKIAERVGDFVAETT
ncbi:alpha/beta hydrolase [Halorientalis salina]|uniref:alpha/beta hydrolase n=1 Tax=Halorientalis salina TaxID=2932266 RepID=UPI0010AC53AD|nr:dienelactone hydrolase family protein [Halorientalis salina]